jgi:hypothetical protein
MRRGRRRGRSINGPAKEVLMPMVVLLVPVAACVATLAVAVVVVVVWLTYRGRGDE